MLKVLEMFQYISFNSQKVSFVNPIGGLVGIHLIFYLFTFCFLSTISLSVVSFHSSLEWKNNFDCKLPCMSA